MENQKFNLIIEKLRNGEIDEDEAKLLLNALKTQGDSFVQSPQQREYIETTESAMIHSKSDIAVIGMSGQFPDAPDIDTFWQNLIQGHDAIHELPAQYISQSQNRSNSQKIYQWGGILAERDCFDPMFFNIAPREAESMNPHQRLILQESWRALEDAGYNPKKFAGSQVGIFIGAEPTGYFYESFTGASEAIVASRLSYFLDLKGAAFVVNTGCSSSGTAIYLACESLRNGESMVAIAGGVSANLSQGSLTLLADIGMLSPIGKCCTFDESADGTVLSEGIGIVVLKRLEDAISDGDHIYGVIRGTGINQDGASNGITAPNGTAEEQLISNVYKQFAVNPEEITYIEAHGTGTKLGDTVEVNALVRAFKQFTNKEHYCIIGSVKSHIGHTTAASAVIGLIKVLLSIQHHQIPGLIHFKKLNPLIELAGSAFYVNTSPVKWCFQNDKPLIAALNSFGHSGTNVHIVIQEYITPDEMFSNQKKPYEGPVLIPISAKNKERLKEYVNNLLKYVKNSCLIEQHDSKAREFCNLTLPNDSQIQDTKVTDNNGNSSVNLTALAYTLQIGREAMEERIVFLVNDIYELISKFEAFLADTEEIANCWRGQVIQGRNPVRLFATDEDMLETVEKWFTGGKLRKIAELWIQGFVFDWNKLYREIKPRRISLPTYPFAKERYWLSETYPKASKTANTFITAAIHPLLHQNTSDLSEQRFSSAFTGWEFFLKDHVIMGQRVLPEVAYLEMARAAVAESVGSSQENNAIIRLKNIIWVQPIKVGEQPAQVHIRLYPEDCAFKEGDGEIAYEIYSLADTDEAEAVVYSQGRAALVEKMGIPVLDLKSLQVECNQRELTGEVIYSTYKVIGLEYGPGHQGIETIYVGKGLVLAKLSLPKLFTGTIEDFVLHPSIMDGALQATIGILAGEGDSLTAPKLSLPFALEELEVYSRCTENMWAVLRYNKDNMVADKIWKFDIELCDEQGQICVCMKGLETQEETEANPRQVVISETQEPYELMTFEEVWQEQAIPKLSSAPLKTIVCFLSKPENQPEIIDAFKQQTKLIFISQGTNYQKQTPQNYSIDKADRNTYEEAFRSIQADCGEIDAILYMWALEDSSCIKDYSSIIYIIQAMATTRLRTKRILLAASFTKDSLEGCYLESWIGFERSLGMILPNTQIAAIYQATEPDQETAVKDWGQKLQEELQIPRLRSVLYQNSKRYISKIRPVTTSSGNSLLRTGGTYLITGGCGGLGFLFAKYVAQKHPVNLVLTGRSAMDAEKQKKIKLLEDLGSQVIYLQANVSNTNAMKARLKQARERFGRIDGVIHAAGIMGNQNILEIGLEDFQKVVESKIAGTQVLDKILKEEPLDFICYFSSAAAILGDFGSCDYAIGNRFEMVYAHYRNRQVTKGLYRGKTVAINWGLWREGGMGFGNDENTKLYLKTSGQRIIETEEGVAILDQILGKNGAQYLILAGQPRRVHSFLGLTEERPVISEIINISSSGRRRVEMKGMSVEQCLEWDLKGFINRLLRIPREKIDLKKNLADFGFDSIGLTQFAIQITKNLGIEITPAIFFGYPTVEKVIQYFLQKYRETIYELYREVEAEKVIPSKTPTPQTRIIKRSRFPKNTTQTYLEPIAIIGMSGRFPGARNIDELWTILATGQDMVKEIPEERFDWRQYYKNPVNESGKINGKWCGCIPGVREFEPLFFEISPKEAETMDPRQRLLLQESWKALEDAGYSAEQIKNQKIGMFVGVEQGDYQLLTRGEGSIGSNNNAILAARLAYFLNLHGPVLAIDTACSSGLVAAHQGILSIRNGECDTAIIAGVNLLLTPGPFILMSQAEMLSEDGKCYAFDKRANGMVPGEAVVAVVLKRLSRAEADGNSIYAVIRGSGINYDGKTNGITAPSGVSQTELLKQVYDQYQVNPEEIEYIVTHGTGTRLGDPIEINALYDAFKEYTSRSGAPKEGFCALTSTKTNFGHTFGASGLVSLISLVQALRHEMIPASLHCEQENDYINWKESPFYVNKANKPWPVREGKVRTGAVSAFGMSGTNAHMVVESYTGKDCTAQGLREAFPYYLLVFSAKTQEVLEEKLKDIIEVLENSDIEQNLIQVSYTLLTGRHHFNYRCATVVQDKGHAISVLKQVLAKEKMPNVFQGEVPREFTGQKAIEQYAQDLLKQSFSLRDNRIKYQETLFALAEFYCQGYEMNWRQLFDNVKMERIHLPTYPFAKEHYWVSEPQGASVDIAPKWADDDTFVKTLSLQTQVHPLLHRNTSDLLEQRYSSTFTGQEFFLKDHVILGQRVLPGVTYLEMARAALAQATGLLAEERRVIKLKNVIWTRPIGVGESSIQVHIRLYPEDCLFGESGSGEITYEVYSITDIDAAEPVVYSQGSAALVEISEIPVLDFQAIRAECSQRNLSAIEIYDFYKAIGLEYGPGFRGIEKIYCGRGQVLAKISLPSDVSNTKDSFVLHPSIMDSALQAAIGFRMGSDRLELTTLTILHELEIFGKCPSSIWALLRDSQKDHPGYNSSFNKQIQKLDIDLCDEQGTVWVRMKGLEIQTDIETEASTSFNMGVQSEIISTTEEAYELMTFEEIWQQEAILNKDFNVNTTLNSKTLVCFLSNPENQQRFTETIQSYYPQIEIIFISQGMAYQRQSPQKYDICKADRNTYSEAFRSIREDVSKDSRGGEVAAILYLWPLEDSDCIEDYSCIVHLLQAMGATKLATKRIHFAAQFNSEGIERCYAESWIGFERSLRMILANIQISAIYQAVSSQTPAIDLEDWGVKIWAELQNTEAKTVLYQDNQRLVYRVQPITLQTGASLLKPGGTYLITGGCGGLGLLFAKHLAKLSRETKPVNLILTGRTPLDAGKQSMISVLESLGCQVVYLQADVSDPEAMREGLGRVAERFGAINGVIHAAGSSGNQNLFENEIQNFLRVLEPKIKGTLVLDETLKAEPLDFICYFSSTSAIIGDFGSCDYAIANRFLMAYAHYRNQQQQKGERQGKTVVINWPVWRDGGMELGDPETTKMYLKTSGQRFLEAEEGLNLFERVLAQNSIQHVVFTGQPKAVRRFIGLTKEAPAASLETSVSNNKPSRMQGRRPEMKGLSVEQCLEWDLKWFINRMLKIPREKIDKRKNLAEFGFNSIGLTQFSIQLIKHYGINEITPALFFAYPTIEKIGKYLLGEHQAVIFEFYRDNACAGALERSSPVQVSKPGAIPKPPIRNNINAARFTARNTRSDILEPIAVIGMSGRFPNADTVEELWDNLVNGRNCISEIPKERWDWREFYGDPSKETNKINSKWGGFIRGVDQFDPLFFNISPKEAEYMDPTQRVFLEEAWRCMEDAGYMGERIRGKRCGVYVGVEEGEYGYLSRGCGFINSNQNATLPARIAYKLDLKGPNMAITASCSSGLVAIHQACQALRQGDCDMALVGGVNLMITPILHIGMSQAGMLSPDGQCYVFDQRANGMVPGEAVAVVLLKPLSKAVLAQDHIYGCIKASGVNYNGKGNGITAPNPLSQAELIQDIYSKYHINPEAIQYIIPHSVGSKLGDPMEIRVLTDIFAKYTTKKQYCAIRSVKPLIGHTFAASGVVSLISMLLVMKHRTILAMKNFETSNEYIDFINSPFLTNLENQTWVSPNHQLRMGAISTTGTSGTNAHAVIEEYLPPEKDILESRFVLPQVIILSAKNQDRLRAVVQQMLVFCERETVFFLADMAYTLQIGREPMTSRLAMVVNTKQELMSGLKAYLNNVGGAKKTGGFPYYTGDLEDEPAEIRDLISGKVADTIVEVFLKEKNLEKIAHYWVKGGEIPWESLHEGETVRRIPLPTYPFAKKSYWITEHHWISTDAEVDDEIQMQIRLTGKGKNEVYTELEKRIAEVWGKELGLREINIYDNFYKMGGNSLIAVKLEVEMGKNGLKIDVSDIDKYPNVAEITSFLSQQTSDASVTSNDICNKKTLDNMIPFNDIFYRNCFYNDLFTVLDHFHKDKMPFLINDVPILTISEDKEIKMISVQYKSYKDYEQLNHEQGIRVNIQLISENIIDDIILGISKNRPVIIMIDCYYAPMREDLYQKEHWAHSWLVFGYDKMRQIFNIIEHRHRGSLTYKTYEVSYEDLAHAYQGYIENYNQDHNQLAYYEYYLEDPSLVEQNLFIENQKMIATNMKNNQFEILEGLKTILSFHENFKIILANQEIEKNADQILEMLNDIINARKADMYKLKSLFIEQEELIKLLSDVIQQWEFIRQKLTRCIYSSTYDQQSLNVILDNFANSYETELKYHQSLLLFFENDISGNQLI